MADIFLSYAREDLPRARQIAHALESTGWDVWWDRDLLPGVDFRAERWPAASLRRELRIAEVRHGDWAIADDGTLYTLPLRSNQIQIGRVDE